MDQSKYIELCRRAVCYQDYDLAQDVLNIVQNYRKQGNEKLPVIWLETDDSGDNNISFMNTTYPYLDKVLDDMIDLLYSNTFMAAQGEDALKILNQTMINKKGEYTLVVEGAIPTKAGGRFNIVFFTENGPVTALEAVKWLAKDAKYIVAIGTCASFGGPSAAEPNLTGCVGVRDLIPREIINVSGCPVNPDWFVGTLAHLMLYGRPELDELGRPLLFYKSTVHRHCQRRSYFDKDDFATELGDQECMFSLGCVGPKTSADCPYRLWVNHVNWPVKANTPCIGCTNPDFPDGSTPFFVPLPAKRIRTGEDKKND